MAVGYISEEIITTHYDYSSYIKHISELKILMWQTKGHWLCLKISLQYDWLNKGSHVHLRQYVSLTNTGSEMIITVGTYLLSSEER